MKKGNSGLLSRAGGQEISFLCVSACAFTLVVEFLVLKISSSKMRLFTFLEGFFAAILLANLES